MVSQRLAEAAGEACLTHFEDILTKPYQEFKDIFAKEYFDELPDWKKWDHTIELIPDSQVFSTVMSHNTHKLLLIIFQPLLDSSTLFCHPHTTSRFPETKFHT